MSTRDLVIVQLNDSHGYLEEHWEHFFQGEASTFKKVGGFSRIAGFVERVRLENNNNILFLDGGDTLHGTYPVVESQGKVLIPILNKLNLDAMTAHWEFAYGPKVFKETAKELNYPVLACNVYDKKTKDLVFDPYLIKEVNDVKIAVIGIAATIVDKVMPEHFSTGLKFTMGKEEVAKYIKILKAEKNVDLILVLSHLGFPQEVKLASEVDGIDILLSSHTHNRTYKPSIINNTIIMQSGCHGSFLGRLDLTYDLKLKKIKSYKHSLNVLDDKVLVDKEMESLVKRQIEPYKSKLERVIGYTDNDLSRNLVLESSMDNFLLNSIIDYTKADVAFSNGWRYGAPVVKGEITVNDIYNIIPTNPPISKVTLTGQEIWDMLEENLERTFATNPYEQMGGYVKRAMNINVYFKIENIYGERIQSLFINGEAIDLEKNYDVAFVTSQGVPLKYGVDRYNLDARAVDVLIAYVEKNKTISAPLKSTFVAV